ncbi:MAG: hypothetical protein RBG13Loki_2414 [Promethearchaeota archaeon CR_4]|nr:MAG: hypothetical protein RBG13Loki_2414 [Candidatus Lokiarchaeota archaeon CR_4]
MNILLSIKPKFTQQILEGTKRFEFRRSISKKWGTDLRVFIYSSSPEKRIVGYFTTKNIIQASPEELWEKCKKFAGIEKEDFFHYFAGKVKGFALEIDVVKHFPNPINPIEIFYQKFSPPQSYCYLESPTVERLLN